MTDYIKKEDAKNAVMDTEPVYAMCKDGIAEVAYQKTVDVIEMIDAIPSADVAPVVRCKDCRHRIKWNDSFGCAFWGYYGDEFADGEMFCRKGERKDDE